MQSNALQKHKSVRDILLADAPARNIERTARIVRMPFNQRRLNSVGADRAPRLPRASSFGADL